MGKISDIATMFKAIAIAHTTIGHNPSAQPPVIRFYTYNMDESNTGDRDGMSYPRLGLSLKNQSGLTGRYQQLVGSVRDTTFIEVVVFDRVDTNNYASEDAAYDAMKQVIDDIVSWINHAVTTNLKFVYPILSYINPDQINYARVKSVSQDNAVGFKMSIAMISEMYYNAATNPLATLDNPS